MSCELAPEELAARAVDGDREALEALCRELQHYVDRLAWQGIRQAAPDLLG